MLDAFTERDDFAREFMAKYISRPFAERFVLRHVKVGPANAAASDGDENLARARRRVGQGLDDEWLVQALKNGCAHYFVKFPSAMPPSISM